MEISFNELDDDSSINHKNTSQVTYDDILAKLNVKIVNGRMQYITPEGISNELFTGKSVASKKTNPFANDDKSNRQIDPKTAYIYNKYFSKESKPTPEPPVILVPKTMEEYKQMLAQVTAQKAEAKRKALLIRPKKLSFHNSNSFMPPASDSPIVNTNQLFRLMKR